MQTPLKFMLHFRENALAIRSVKMFFILNLAACIVVCKVSLDMAFDPETQRRDDEFWGNGARGSGDGGTNDR